MSHKTAASAAVIPVEIASPSPAASQIRNAVPLRTFSFTVYDFMRSGPTRGFRTTRRADQTSGLEAPAGMASFAVALGTWPNRGDGTT